jgi:hypothetical protein
MDAYLAVVKRLRPALPDRDQELIARCAYNKRWFQAVYPPWMEGEIHALTQAL